MVKFDHGLSGRYILSYDYTSAVLAELFKDAQALHCHKDTMQIDSGRSGNKQGVPLPIFYRCQQSVVKRSNCRIQRE